MPTELAVVAGISAAGELAEYAPDRPAAAGRRGRRRVRVLLVLALVVVALAWAAARTESALGSVPASAPERRPVPSTYLVQPGDTLWTIARQLKPEGDVRPVVHKLADLNGGAELEVGQVLALP